MSQDTETINVLKKGKKTDVVELSIDYQIIEHFSKHLYGSSNKAVEELVSNSFDAFATNVYIYLPGKFTADHVIVWDDGTAMNTTGFKQLWWIARSPKEDNAERIVKERGKERKMIGKFGIGKLASYAVGKRITHLCRRGDQFLLVSIDYKEIDGEAGKPRVSNRRPYKTPIVEITEEEAREYVKSLFNDKANPLAIKKAFNLKTWTLAVIGELKKEITHGRLTWLLGTGMPLRPDFNVFVDDEAVSSKLESDAFVTWDFSSKEVQQTLQDRWREGRKKGLLDGDISFGAKKGIDSTQPKARTPYAEFPNLGLVWGRVRLFERSLLAGKAAEHGRSHGFFILVRDRLLNDDDDKVLLGEPSFGTFYRSQFTLHIDALDKDLLADRERLHENTPRTRELAVLQRALHTAARAVIDTLDLQKAAGESGVSLLPILSREHYREPVSALLMKVKSSGDALFDISNPQLIRKPVGEDEPLAILSPEDKGFAVNTSHPYYDALRKKVGDSKKSQEFFRAYDMFSVAERLLEGYLYDAGISDSKVKMILEWRDGLFRKFAERLNKVPAELEANLINMSFLPGKPFENALVDLLNDMGFDCERDGLPGKKDVILKAEIGPEKYKFTFETKGSVNAVLNDVAEIGGAAGHREKADAEHAVVVAREFVGFDKNPDNDDAAVLNECRSVKNVSIMTVEALVELHRAMSEFGYTLDSVKDIFREIETPKAKLERIRALQSPMDDFNYRLVLDALWKHQGSEASGDYVPYRAVWQSRFRKQHKMELEDFHRKLVALGTLSGGRIRVIPERELVCMRQSPKVIAEHIERMLTAVPSTDDGAATTA